MQIDLNTSVVESEIKVWAFHPGKQKRFYKYFAEHGRFFLDLPGAKLSRELVDDDLALRKSIAMSHKISSLVRRKMPTDEISRNFNDYAPVSGRGYNHVITSIKRFTNEINRNDIILVAPRRQYDRILFGKVNHEFRTADRILVNPFTRDAFDTRPITWIPSSVSKRNLSDGLAIKLENRHTVVELTGEYRKQALAAAYFNYITPTASKLDVDCPLYRGKNPLETVEVQELISFFSAIFYMHENNILSEAAGKDFNQISRNYYEEDLVAGIETEFHSPGHYRLYGKSAAYGLFLITCITLASLGKFTPEDVEQLALINTQSGATIEQNEHIKRLIRSTVNSVTPEVCAKCNAKGTYAKSNLGMNTHTQVTR